LASISCAYLEKVEFTGARRQTGRAYRIPLIHHPAPGAGRSTGIHALAPIDDLISLGHIRSTKPIRER
jgi:hypothetical protein